jgi:dTDP-4-dehydrorhamnose 3,5-epimerase
MNIIETAIPAVKIIEPQVFGDTRGFFMESWNQEKFADAGLNLNFVQDNHSRSTQGILRGLHYQTEHTQGKLVRVTSGKVFDVAVDIREDSETLGQWVGVELSDENHRMLWVPPGFAHGFYVMSESADFLYKCTGQYHPQSEQSILWNDPAIGIEWPLVNNQSPVLSQKDEQGLLLKDAPLLNYA